MVVGNVLCECVETLTLTVPIDLVGRQNHHPPLVSRGLKRLPGHACDPGSIRADYSLLCVPPPPPPLLFL